MVEALICCAVMAAIGVLLGWGFRELEVEPSLLLQAFLFGPAAPSAWLLFDYSDWKFGALVGLALWGAWLIGLLAGRIIRDVRDAY